MKTKLQVALDSLTADLLRAATLVKEQHNLAVKSFLRSDKELAKGIVNRDSEVDKLEVEIEEQCLSILALYRPLAADLRKTVSVLKINNDLERIGDLAANMARRAMFVSSDSLPIKPIDVSRMAELSSEMLTLAIKAFAKMDSQMARTVCDSDLHIDAIHRENYAAIYKSILDFPDYAESLIQFIAVSRYLERTGDLATNIAEDVIYSVEGEIVRHRDVS